MIHISQEELLKKIEQEHKQLFETEQEDSRESSSYIRKKEDMSSILPTTCSRLRDRNNNAVDSEDEDEIQAVLITGNS